MTRIDKYPDTDVFHYHNQNPHNRITTDCVIRALSLVTNTPYNTVVMDLAAIQCKTGYDDAEPRVFGRYLESKGFRKMPQPRKSNGKKYTGKEFCKLNPSITCYAHIGGNHDTAIINGKIFDIWDCSGGCIGNYWIKD